jgi:hypothetical protein
MMKLFKELIMINGMLILDSLLKHFKHMLSMKIKRKKRMFFRKFKEILVLLLRMLI